MKYRSCSFSLHKDIQHRPDHRNKVQGQIEQRSQQRPRVQPRERASKYLTQPSDGIFPSRSGFHLASLRYEWLLVTRDQGAIEGIDQGVFDEERPREDVCYGGTFAKYENRCGNSCQWATSEGHDGHLWHVREEEHDGRDAYSQRDSSAGARYERAPEVFVGRKVDNSLRYIQLQSETVGKSSPRMA